MKAIAVGLILVMWMACARAQTAETSQAAAEQPSTTEQIQSLQSRLQQWSQQLSEKLQALEGAVERINKRLGETFRAPSPFDTIERRIEDLGKKMDRLERDLQKIEGRLDRLERGR